MAYNITFANQIVGVSKGKISFITKDVFPVKAIIIEGKGKYLMLEIADMIIGSL
jgi:hypothetical protein